MPEILSLNLDLPTFSEIKAEKALRFPQSTAQGPQIIFPTLNDMSAAILRAISPQSEPSDDPHLSSLVAAGITWLANTLPEPDLLVKKSFQRKRAGKKRDDDVVEKHPFYDLMDGPNPEDTGSDLWRAFAYSWIIKGNVYFLKLRKFGRVVRLYYEPHHRVQARWVNDKNGEYLDASRSESEPTVERSDDPRLKINYFQLLRDGVPHRVEPADIVHFKDGIDPFNERYGISRIQTILREIYGDSAVASYAADLLGGNGVIPYVLGIDDPQGTLGQPDLDNIKAKLNAQTTGKNAGQPLVLTSRMTFERTGLTPAELDLRQSRYMAQEVFSAVTGIPSIVLNFGSGMERCLPAETRVSTVERGPVCIPDVRVGEQVWSLSEKGLVARAVTWSGLTGRNQQLYKIKTRNRTIRATDGHPFPVRRRKKLPAPNIGQRHSPEWCYWVEWVPVRDLVAGDCIVEPLVLPDTNGISLPDGTPASAHLLQWLGAFVGDGCYQGKAEGKGANLTLCIPRSDRVAAPYRALTQQLFTKQITLKDQPVNAGSKWWKPVAVLDPSALGVKTAPCVLREVYNGFTFSSKHTFLWLESLGFHRGAKNKRIPPWVFSLSVNLRLAFLRGLLDTDGTVNKRGHAVFRFASEGLTKDLWHLALGLGMSVSNIYPVRVPADRLPNAGRRLWYDSWQFTIMSAEDVRRIGTEDPKYQQYLNAVTERKCKPARNNSNGNHILPDDCVFLTIQSITPDGFEDVYDLTVAGSHNFIADGLIVHNSIYNNMSEADRRAVTSYLQPIWWHRDQVLTRRLLRDLDQNEQLFIESDLSEVGALQEDENEAWKRWGQAYQDGWLKRSEVRTAANYENDPGGADDVYYVRGGSETVTLEQEVEQREEPDPLSPEGQQLALVPPVERKLLKGAPQKVKALYSSSS